MSDGWMTLRARGDQWLHDHVHVPEIHNIAIEEAEKKYAQLLNELDGLIDNVANSVIGAYSSDVNTIVKIGFATKSYKRSIKSDIILLQHLEVTTFI